MPNQLDGKELNSKLFRERLKKVGKTQKEIGEALAIKEKTFSAYLPSGNFDEATLKAIADMLGVLPDDLWIQGKADDSVESIDFRKEYYAAIARENKLLREKNSSSDFLATRFEAIEGLLQEIYVEIRKQREMTEKRMSSNKDTSKV